jgi:hypothetical protein
MDQRIAAAAFAYSIVLTVNRLRRSQREMRLLMREHPAANRSLLVERDFPPDFATLPFSALER